MSKFFTEDPQTIVATAQNLVDTATWRPEFCLYVLVYIYIYVKYIGVYTRTQYIKTLELIILMSK